MIFSPQSYSFRELCANNSFPRRVTRFENSARIIEAGIPVLPTYRNGQWGYWQKRRSWNFTTENYDEEGSGMMGELILLPDLWFGLNHSLDHYRTMANPIVQAIHQGQRDFVDNPFGGGLLAFVTGGGLMGAGGGALARSAALRTGTSAISRLASKTAISSLSIARQNLVRYGVRNISINASAQFTSILMSEETIGDIDIADIAISGIAGNSFAMAAIGVSLVNFRADGNLSSGFSNPYKGLTDLGTGLFFGAISNQIPGSNQIGKGLSFTAGFANELWSNLTNWTISQGN